tara:strand:+ start:29 stop:247 length:219 start_codon:yes stop_codon:yes gene_type:complete
MSSSPSEKPSPPVLRPKLKLLMLSTVTTNKHLKRRLNNRLDVFSFVISLAPYALISPFFRDISDASNPYMFE